MGDDTKQIIKVAAIAAGVYFVYQYLQSSGLWAQWFGGTNPVPTNQFSDPALLLNYCQSNPTGNASYVQANGTISTAPCSQWLQSNEQAGTPPPVTTTPSSSLGSNYQQAIASMQTAAGSNSQNLDNWAYFWQTGAPFSGSPTGFGVAASISPTQMDQIIGLGGGDRNASVSAEQFVAWLNQTSGTGVSGIMSDAAYENAYVN